jgi:DNA repair exonuclease SbcCD ATPase subunit
MGFDRRKQGEGAHDDASEESQPRQPAKADEGDRPPVTDAPLLSAFLPRTLREKGQLTPSEHEHHPLAENREAGEAPGNYREVGAHVASVLAFADNAAEQIRQEARQEAIRIQEDARQETARIRQEAEEAVQESNQQRSDIERYIAEARATTERYAEEKQQQADAEASNTRVNAENDARSIVGEAERRARAIEKAARLRGAEIEEESRRAEERLKELLAVIRTLTGQLEDMLGVEEDEAVLTADTDEPPEQPRSARRAAS